MTRATRIYIAGPMTGIENHNFPAFNRAAEELRAAGWDVVNPADRGIIEGFEWADYLRYDLTKLASCTDIYLLPGWERSKGASLEHHIATTLGMNRHYAAGAYWAEPLTDAKVNEITALKLGPWPSFEAQSWACKVVKAIGHVPPPLTREALEDLQKPYRLDAARYQDVCRVLNELLPGWDDTSRHGDSGLAPKAIRALAERAEGWGAVVTALDSVAVRWRERLPKLVHAAVKTIREVHEYADILNREKTAMSKKHSNEVSSLRVRAEAWGTVWEALDEVVPSWAADVGPPNLDFAQAAVKAIRKLAFLAASDPSDAVTSPESMMLLEIHAELKRARGLFPGDRIMTLAMAEEFGELVKAVLDEPAANVRKEAVQTAVMAMRVVLDGDGSVNEWRAAKGLDALGVQV